MPMQKDLKRLVRGRMKKTGESYTTARLHLLNRKSKAPQPDYAALAGKSDAAVKKATGRDWATWVKTLDEAHAHQWKHRDIARYIKDTFDTPDWWTQSVTVGYERIKGLRAEGQRSDGRWAANRSRTFPVAVSRLFDAFSKPSQRAKWLGDANIKIRKKTPPKTIRIAWESDGTTVEAYFLPKGDAKSSVAIQHSGLASKADVDRMKSFWGERLDALGRFLA